MTTHPQTVAVLGASNKPDRYSYKAVRLLKEHGHTVIPIHPALTEVDTTPVTPTLADITAPVDTLTLYLNPARSADLTEDIIDLNPARVIFNPGTESPDLAAALDENSIPHQDACTLVLLNTHQF
ncbi:MAG: CoA-binding protein [Verrucomicrobiota bacterium]